MVQMNKKIIPVFVSQACGVLAVTILLWQMGICCDPPYNGEVLATVRHQYRLLCLPQDLGQDFMTTKFLIHRD